VTVNQLYTMLSKTEVDKNYFSFVIEKWGIDVLQYNPNKVYVWEYNKGNLSGKTNFNGSNKRTKNNASIWRNRECFLFGKFRMQRVEENNKFHPCLPHRVFHGFRLTKQDDYFWVKFDHFWIEHWFLRQLGQ